VRLSDKIAVVTGATQGIGRGIARRFASEGASVVIAGRNESKGKAVEEGIRCLGGEAFYIRTDVGVAKDVKHLIQQTIEKYDTIDILVNNAGVNVAKGTPFYALTLSQWQQTIDVNLTGTFLCSWEASKLMIERQQGKIINIASVHGLATASGNAAYAASKAGIIQLTKAMAVDLAPHGIQVNAIAPGAIALEDQPEDSGDVINDYILLNRWGTIDEVASLALFLSCGESSYINGETVRIDGGLMTLLPGKPVGTP
jgi:NAD(P)-dependent dehydrogenase (short-subunit alcohol dehydrogenase family)